MFKHMIEDTSNFMGGGGNGFRGPVFSPNATIKTTQGTLTTTGTLSGKSKGRVSPIIGFLGLTL